MTGLLESLLSLVVVFWLLLSILSAIRWDRDRGLLNEPARHLGPHRHIRANFAGLSIAYLSHLYHHHKRSNL
jgi:hypothetical protein